MSGALPPGCTDSHVDASVEEPERSLYMEDLYPPKRCAKWVDGEQCEEIYRDSAGIHCREHR